MNTRNRVSPSSPTSGLLMRFQNGFQLKRKFLAVELKLLDQGIFELPGKEWASIFNDH
jgi:hypothetical protein